MASKTTIQVPIAHMRIDKELVINSNVANMFIANNAFRISSGIIVFKREAKSLMAYTGLFGNCVFVSQESSA